jgi:hypothetical protein
MQANPKGRGSKAGLLANQFYHLLLNSKDKDGGK